MLTSFVQLSREINSVIWDQVWKYSVCVVGFTRIASNCGTLWYPYYQVYRREGIGFMEMFSWVREASESEVTDLRCCSVVLYYASVQTYLSSNLLVCLDLVNERKCFLFLSQSLAKPVVCNAARLIGVAGSLNCTYSNRLAYRAYCSWCTYT